LTTTNAEGSNTLTKNRYINVTSGSGGVVPNPGYIVPVSAFLGSPTSGNVPLTVSFTDQSTGSPTSRRWTFGDGNTSTTQNPVHTYNKKGLYTVSLTTTNANGSNVLTKSSYIAVSNSISAPTAAFSASTTLGNAPLSVSFTDQSTGSPTSWKWNFGDGSTSTTQNPVHVYSKAGKYTVSLTLTNPGGSSTETISGYITVK
jgi:PKD repeat protein